MAWAIFWAAGIGAVLGALIVQLVFPLPVFVLGGGVAGALAGALGGLAGGPMASSRGWLGYWKVGFLLLLAPLLPGLAIALYFFVPINCPPGQITRCNFEKIRDGMTMSEVQALLGKGEVRAESPESSELDERTGKFVWKPIVTGVEVFLWEIPSQRRILVGFQDGRVCSKDFWEPYF